MSIVADTTPVVLVHGWAGSAESWTPIHSVWEAATGHAPLIALRLPGSPGDHSGRETTVREAGQLLESVLTGLPRPALLIGHSMGAQVTLMAHSSTPHLVVGEVVLDPAYGGDSTVDEMETWATQIEAEGHQALDSFFASAMSTRLPAVSQEQIRSDLSGTSVRDLARYLRSEYVDDDAIGLVAQTIVAASRRTQPVLAIHSTSQGASVEATLPSPAGSEVELWDGYGHYLHLEDPLRFVSTVLVWAKKLSPTLNELVEP